MHGGKHEMVSRHCVGHHLMLCCGVDGIAHTRGGFYEWKNLGWRDLGDVHRGPHGASGDEGIPRGTHCVVTSDMQAMQRSSLGWDLHGGDDLGNAL